MRGGGEEDVCVNRQVNDENLHFWLIFFIVPIWFLFTFSVDCFPWKWNFIIGSHSILMFAFCIFLCDEVKLSRSSIKWILEENEQFRFGDVVLLTGV